ncbi:hypothetical protein J437_LFUL013364 [Ladona fulva]|uniref:Uncharacterized protein n=1 Tax=Ladona fulva TaxID=123851 RepID=A0A8K0P1T9_LADFU|nr:hypothetical protein J437_LFUL013364 [Ladona fulva]
MNDSLLSFSFATAGPTIEVQAVTKGTAILPCDIVPPIANDSAILVIWYKNEMTAIYRMLSVL